METPVTALTQDPRTRCQDKDGASPRQLQITNRVSGQRCGASSPSGPSPSSVGQDSRGAQGAPSPDICLCPWT